MTLIAICVVGMVVIAFLAIPADVRALMGENCRGSNGRLKPRYVLRECQSVAQFYLHILLVTAILALLILMVALLIDEFVIPLEMVRSAAAQADLDPEVFKQNLTSRPDNVSEEHRTWFLSRGGTEEGAYSLQRFLWNALPVALLLSFAMIVGGLRLLAGSHDWAIGQLLADEVARDRRRIRRRYLRQTSRRSLRSSKS